MILTYTYKVNISCKKNVWVGGEGRLDQIKLFSLLPSLCIIFATLGSILDSQLS